ncbi:hypothetical protein [Kitasatospora sp. NPDC004272]
MNLLLVIRSWRLRSALTWLRHNSIAALLPILAVGTLDVTDLGVPEWLRVSAGPLTVVLVVAGLAGQLLHRELDQAGVPCRWCDVELVDELDAEDY